MAEVKGPELKGQVKGELVPPKKVESTRKKFEKAMIAEDVNAALTNVLWNRAVPGFKRAFMETLHGTIDAFFNWSATPSNKTPTQYNSFYGGAVNYNRMEQISETSSLSRPSSLREIPFDLKEDAINTLASMRSVIEETGFVTVNMVCGWLKKSCDYTWNDYGWNNLDTATVTYDQGRQAWVLHLPKCSPINR